MLSVLDVARYFLVTQDEDAGESITNLKLQKLCYYAQGFHLAIFDTPLFPEPIEAWQHGPVVEVLWRAYRDYGSGPIPKPEDVDISLYDNDTVELLDEVNVVYGQYSAWKLRNLTHEEPPWKEAAASTSGIISPETMRAYFKTLVND